MRALLCIAVLGAGCRSLLGIDDPLQLDGGGDGSNDGSHPDGESCFGAAPLTVCLASSPTGSVVVPATIDTSKDVACSFIDSQLEACVITGTSITIESAVSVTGGRALVLLATDTLTLGQSGSIDVASHAGGTPGPAANDPGCITMGSNGTGSVNGGGGGAGGSLGNLGGVGGAGDQGAFAGGLPIASLRDPSQLRGGCPGGFGGPGSSLPPPGGSGGGAIYLLAGNVMTLSGSIDASGAGGGGGLASKSGGGGGGSGGLIVLWATSLATTSNTAIFANGGGGGGGADNGAPGQPGSDSPAPAFPAFGGQGGSAQVGVGGAGAVGKVAGSDGTMDQTGAGGGGGGGGGGTIRVLSGQVLGGEVSPPMQ